MSSTLLRDYFRAELRDYANQLAALVRDDEPMESPGELLRLARALRGTAHLAGEEPLFRVAAALEAGARALIDRSISWSTDTRERAERTFGDIEVILTGAEEEAELERRAEEAERRWQALGVLESAEPAEPADGGLDDEAFLSFAAGEIDGIVSVLGASIESLQTDPLDREAMRAVLRRQRALLGTARLEDLPAVAETLQAVEDVSGIIARMAIGIKDEWLEVFRCARMVLDASAGSLARGEDTPHTPALSRLRTYRQELLERYGAAEESAAVLDPGGPQPPRDGDADPAAATSEASAIVPGESVDEGIVIDDDVAGTQPGAAGDTLDIQNLMYTGESALRRALGLRARLEQAVADDPDALAIVDEVFDLIRLGLK